MKAFFLTAPVVTAVLLGGCQSDPRLTDTGHDVLPAVSRLQKPDPDALDADSPPPSGAAEPLDFGSRGRVVAVVRATVNGVPILDGEVRNACFPALRQVGALAEPERSQRLKEVLDQALDALVERELVLQEAMSRLKANGGKHLDKIKELASKEFDKQILRDLKRSQKFKSEEEMKAYLREQGTSLDTLRKQFERQFIFQQYLSSRIGPMIDRVGHQQILSYYNQHPEEFTAVDAVEWQDLFVAASRHPSRRAAHDLAEEVAARARAGEDFVGLVKEHDNGDSSYRAGAGLGTKRGEIKPLEAEAILFALKDGEVGPVVELSGGFHVVRLVKRTYAGALPFDEPVQAKIRTKLKNEIFSEEAKRIVADLRRTATIEIADLPWTPPGR